MSPSWVTTIYILFVNRATVTENAHEKIIKWWTNISEQKPYHCKLNEIYKKPFHPTAEKFVKSLLKNPMFR